jgi:hypothetical protein
LLVAPSPKFQDHPVIVPVELSVNETARGCAPLVGVALKLAEGAITGFTVMEVVLELENPFGPRTVSVAT